MERFYVTRGDAFNLPITFTDNTDSENPIAFDLTGCTVFFTVKYLWDKSVNDDNAIISKSKSVHDDAVNGQTSFYLTSDDTDHECGTYKADMQLIDGSGNINSTEQFEFCIVEDVTKSTS